MSGSTLTCAVTGASGYVGSRIVAHLERRGHRTVALRRDVGGEAVDRGAHAAFTLERGVGPGALAGVDVLVHAAYDFAPTTWRAIARVNVDGARRLFDAARASGVDRIVAISTLSAFEGCRSMYGRAKLAIERAAGEAGGVSVRPGLVWGDRPGGTLGALERVVTSLPVVPLVGGRCPQFLCHEDDLSRLVAVLAVADRELPSGPFVAAAERAMPLGRISRRLARRRGARTVFVPVPLGFAYAGLRLLEAIGLRAGFRSDSLVSLAHADSAPDFGPTRAIGVTFRDFEDEA